MTAVEWLLSELAFINSLDDVIDGSAKAILTTAVIKQATAMEKSQITDAYIMGSYDMAEKEFRPEEYYNEVYGREGTPDTSSPNIKNK